ncbi:MAG: thermostable hemolysin [Pseudomonadales bacterium]|jgi:hypothetical protein
MNNLSISHTSPGTQPGRDDYLSPNTLNIQAVDLGHPERDETQAFIIEGFATIHNASVHQFMPNLISLRDKKIRAVIGVRSAKEPLFIERYLDLPIEQHGRLNIPRQQIAEVGNLVSSSRHFTLLLFMVTATSLDQAGFKEMVFCATGRVADILRCAGASPQPIAEADGERLGASLAEWGRYYDQQPVVMHLNLASVVALIQSSPLLKPMCERFRASTNEIVSQLNGDRS